MFRATLAALAVLTEPLPARADPPQVTVLWPRVIPRDEAPRSDALAAQVQQAVLDAVRRALPGRPVEVRPQGERSCPEAGCPGGSAGALLIRKGEGCAVVGLAGWRGRGQIRLAAWAGTVELKKLQVDFREPPESSVRVQDFARCAEVAAQLAARAEQMDRTLRHVHGP